MVLSLVLLAMHRLQTPAQSAAPNTAPHEIVVPGFTAYGVPDRDRLEVSPDGTKNWTNPSQSIQWHGRLTTGELTCSLWVRLPAGQVAQIGLSVAPNFPSQNVAPILRRGLPDPRGIVRGRAPHTATVKGAGDDPVLVEFPSFPVFSDGYHTITLQGIYASGGVFPEVVSLNMKGTATVGAQFNLKERRNAASVHLSYPIEKDAQVAWFYNEVTPRKDPLYTYYMACGFSRGYFGMQVNSPTERRIIFSVWDASNGNDPNQVPEGLRTKLVAKGDDVFASAFGNEGTGGHSHLVYPWVVDKTYRFLVGAKAEDNATVYTGYFYDPEQSKWTLIASFRAAKDGGLLRNLYSFDENFGGSNGDLPRLAEFGNGWIGSPDGKWRELLQARFSHDATGKADRLDYAAKAVGTAFALRTGGFLDEPPTKYGSILIRNGGGEQPKDLTLPPTPRG